MTSGKKVGAIVALAGAALVVAVVAAIAWYWRRIPVYESSATATVLVPPPATIRTVAGNPIRSPAEVEAATPQEILHYADALNSPAQSPRADALLLVSLIELYRSVLHTTDPVGDNEEITAILTGNNHLGYAFIRPGSKAINAQGQLCDRWGTPYFFHQISGTEMQIRSGGPDGKLWTKDDIVAGP